MINDLVDAFQISYNTASSRVDMLVEMNIVKRIMSSIEIGYLLHKNILIYLWIPDRWQKINRAFKNKFYAWRMMQ